MKSFNLKEIIEDSFLECDSCRNYHIDADGTNDGYHTACKNYLLSRQYKQLIMNEKIKDCKGYEKI